MSDTPEWAIERAAQVTNEMLGNDPFNHYDADAIRGLDTGLALARYIAEKEGVIAEPAKLLEEQRATLSWIIEQAEGAMAISAGCATTSGDPEGGLQMLNSIASDIAVNARMALNGQPVREGV